LSLFEAEVIIRELLKKVFYYVIARNEMTKQSPNIIDDIKFLRSARNDYNGHFPEVSIILIFNKVRRR